MFVSGDLVESISMLATKYLELRSAVDSMRNEFMKELEVTK